MSDREVEIDRSAQVDPLAKLGVGVVVGPFAVIGPEVELADDVVVEAHAVVKGKSTIGARTHISPFACVGGEGQIKGLVEAPGRLSIGSDNVIREQATINAGSSKGSGCTRIGNDNIFMIGSHVGHDCEVGSHCVIANLCALGGQVRVEDYAVLGAYSAVHQNGRVGESVMAAGSAKLTRDAPPFSIVAHDRARWVGVNTIGLERRGFSKDAIATIKHAYHVLFHSKLRYRPALAQVREELGDVPEIARLLDFLDATERGICR